MIPEIRLVAYTDLEPIIEERQGRYMDNDPPRTWFGAFVGGQIVGCCACQRVPGHASVGLWRNDYGRQAFRRRGIFRALWQARIAWCHEQDIRFISTKASDMILPMYLASGFSVLPDWPHTTPVVADLEAL